MKNKQVTAMLMAMAFSASTMTACGAYGGMESSVYGSVESYEMTSEELEEMERQEAIDLYGWEYDMPQHEAYEKDKASRVEFGDCCFYIPDYMTEEDTDEEGMKSYLAEESDTDFARLTLKEEILDITIESVDNTENSENSLDHLLWEKEDALMMDERLLSIQEAMILDQYSEFYILHETVNGVNVSYYYAFVLTAHDEHQAKLITVCFTTTEGCSFNYRDNFYQFLENCEFLY